MRAVWRGGDVWFKVFLLIEWAISVFCHISWMLFSRSGNGRVLYIREGFNLKGDIIYFSNRLLLSLRAKHFACLWFQEPKQPKRLVLVRIVPVIIMISSICTVLCSLQSSSIISLDLHINPMIWLERHSFLYFAAMKSKKILSVSPWSHSMWAIESRSRES